MVFLLQAEDNRYFRMGAGAPVGAVNAQMGQAARRSDYEALFQTKAKDLVKGVGHIMAPTRA